MTIGASIFCLVTGAILTFAVETEPIDGVNLDNIGKILMIAGVVGLVFYALIWAPRTRRIARPVTVVDDRRVVEPIVQERVVVQPAATSTPVVERRVSGS